MEELKVPTRRITVDLFTNDGLCSRGAMYHTESLYETGSAADIVTELNDERVFVPFQCEDPAVGHCLISKRHLVRIHLPGLTAADLASDEAVEIRPASTCTLLLDDGSRRTGQPLVETPVSLQRLVDKFNRADSFVPFVTDDGVDFVHTTRIVRVLFQD